MRTHALLAHHPDTGVANQPVGVLAVNDDDFFVSWIPDTPQEGWRQKLQAVVDNQLPISAAVDEWYETANGTTWGIDVLDVAVELPTPAHAAEAAVDAILSNADAGHLFTTS